MELDQYVPELLEQRRRRSEAERVPLTFQVADAEQLPFPDESFDVVRSTFGVMFAPNQERAAKELRVVKPGRADRTPRAGRPKASSAGSSS